MLLNELMDKIDIIFTIPCIIFKDCYAFDILTIKDEEYKNYTVEEIAWKQYGLVIYVKPLDK